MRPLDSFLRRGGEERHRFLPRLAQLPLAAEHHLYIRASESRPLRGEQPDLLLAVADLRNGLFRLLLPFARELGFHLLHSLNRVLFGAGSAVNALADHLADQLLYPSQLLQRQPAARSSTLFLDGELLEGRPTFGGQLGSAALRVSPC